MRRLWRRPSRLARRGGGLGFLVSPYPRIGRGRTSSACAIADAGQVGNEAIDFGASLANRLARLQIRRPRERYHQVGAAQEEIDVLLGERNAVFLGGDQDVFHGMGERHAGIEIDDPGSALQRMRGAHASFELVAGMGIMFEGKQARGQHLRLTFRLQAEEVLHRKLAEILAAHARL